MSAANDQIAAKWQTIAIWILDAVRSMLNAPDMIGGPEETGVVILFFNQNRHGGKSTMVSTATDVDDLRRLLGTALSDLDKARVIEPGRAQ